MPIFKDENDVLGKLLTCPKRNKTVAVLSSYGCLSNCKYFPCELYTKEDIRILYNSPFVENTLERFNIRRTNMYIVKYRDGSYVELPELDMSNINIDRLHEVEVVYQISKELVPVVTLKPRPKEDRDRIVRITNNTEAVKKRSRKAK